MNTPGSFIVIDGPSGVGKSTVVPMVAALLTQAGQAVHATAQPSKERLGRLARFQTDLYHGVPLACLVAADRYQHLNTSIEPALADGKLVLCDRYVPSSMVLQILDGVDLDFVVKLNALARVPDLTVILIGDADRSATRAAERDGTYSRFHDPLRASREVELYVAVVDRMGDAGQPVVLIDVEDRPAKDVATKIAKLVTDWALGDRVFQSVDQ